MSRPGANTAGVETGHGVLHYLVHHRTAANLLLLLMLVGGLAAGTKIRAQFFPDVVVENVSVRVAWPGAGPDDVDRAVLARLEPVLRAVEGVESTSASAGENSASITLELEPGWDMGRAMDEVKAAVDGVSDLPEGVEEPVITRGAFRDRVTDVVIHGPVGFELLGRYAAELQRRLFAADVSRTTMRGVADPLIEVAVPEASLLRHDLTLSEIAEAVAADSDASPAGDLGSGAARVRTGVDRRSVESLNQVALRTRADGSRLFLRDVATVVDEGAASGAQFFHAGQPAVMLRVDRSARDDAIDLQRSVEEVVAAMQPTLPDGVTIRLTGTRSQAIADRLGILLDNGLLGLALVLVFLFLFLSARTAFWVAMGIPAAMAATIALMYLFGVTLNMVSLFALIICLGIVVDDAIVVGEHADMLAQRGHSPAEAASLAATRMAPPVFSASITTVIAFTALVAVGGRFGDLIVDIPLTVAMVMLASLMESFLVLPAHMRHALSARNRAPWYDAPSRVFNRGFAWFRERAFRPAFRAAIAARYPLLGVAVMLLLVSLAAFFDGTVSWRFFNAPERGTISANVLMLPGAKREGTREMLDAMQRALDEVNAEYAARHGAAPVDFSLATLGGGAGRGLHGADSRDADLLGGFAVELIDPDLRSYSAFEFIGDWERRIVRHPLLETLAVRGQRSGPGGDSIDVELSGAGTGTLKSAALAVREALAGYPGVSALEDTLPWDKPEYRVRLTPRGEALGFDSAGLGRELAHRLRGIDAVEFPVGDRTATIRVMLPESERGAGFLDETRVRAPDGGLVPLAEIVDVDSRLGFASIRREDGERVVRVTGDVAGDDAAALTRDLAERILPDVAARFGVDWHLAGLAEQEREFLSDAVFGFSLCLIGIYLTLAWIFASWLRPTVIMAIIPFGVVGMIWGHYLHDLPISMFSVVGFVGMSGIIINDAIVLISTVDVFHRRMALSRALVEAACERLRPVILTTATTVFGLTPLLFEQSRQAQFLKPTVITLVYGLGAGLGFVLLLTPALVMMQHDVTRSLRSLRRLLRWWLRPRRTAG